MRERLQPEREIEPNPDAEDEAHDAGVQHDLDEETARDELRAEAKAKAIATAAALLGVSGDTALATLGVLYELGHMDGTLRAARESML